MCARTFILAREKLARLSKYRWGLSGKSNLCNRISFSVCLSRPVGVAIKKNRWAGRGRGYRAEYLCRVLPQTLPFVSEFELPARAHTSLCVWAAHTLTGGKERKAKGKRDASAHEIQSGNLEAPGSTSPRGGVEVPLHGRGTRLHRADNVLRWRKTSAVALSLVGGQKLEDVVPDRW